MAEFTEIKPDEITENPFKLIGGDWFLITAGTLSSFNTMTAGWGGFGILWHKNVCTIYVRPGRYTYDFLEKNDMFTLSFFDEKYKDALKLCGTKSGRDIDKPAEAGITPFQTPDGSVSFEEARLVIECLKIYTDDIDPSRFLKNSIEKSYPSGDYHRVYVGEIRKVLTI